MTVKQYYTWDSYSNLISNLKQQITSDDYDFVLGIARGGLIPAVELSHFLKKPLLVLNWQTRDGNPPTTIPTDIYLAVKGSKILIVDDICDSGETLHQIFQAGIGQHLCGVDIAVIHYNEAETLFVPDFYSVKINKVENPVWIVYPWEKQDD